MRTEPGTRKQKNIALFFFSSLATIAIVLFVLGVAGVFDAPKVAGGDLSGESSPRIYQTVPVPPGVISVTAGRLEMVYGSNKGAADAMYRGKMLLVSGMADPGFNDSEDPDAEPYLYFKAASPVLSGVHVSFRPSEKSKLIDLSEGDSVSVLCRGDGAASTIPQLTDCLLQARTLGANALLGEQIKAALVSHGEKLDYFRYHPGTVDCSINTGDWFTVGAAGLRNHLSKPLRDLYTLAYQFPQIETMAVTLESPGSARKDEFGHELPAGMATIVFLEIHTGDFSKFSRDFEWDSYPVYAANRYATGPMNHQVQEIWYPELKEETELGGFR